MIIGITGGIASGKSLVSSILRQHGYRVLDADRIAKEIVIKGTEVYHELVGEFGEDILDASGGIDRSRLASIVFKNENNRAKINQIMHPPIRKIILTEAKEVEKSEGIVFLDIPLLFETGYNKSIDKTVVVYTSFSIQLERLMKRDHIDESYARSKMESQMPLDKKKTMADFIIDNNGTTSTTRKQVERLLDVLLEGEYDGLHDA